MNAALAYALQSIGWGGAGFLAGLLVGRAARDVHRIATAVTGKNPEDGDKPMPARRPRWTERAPSTSLIAIVVVCLGVVTVVQGIVQSDATARVTRCQVNYSNDFSDALDARTRASTDAQNALDELLTTVGETLNGNTTSRTRIQQAINDYLAKRAAVKHEQAQHPYPPPPRESCP
ncbi:hypothetical protein ACWEVP_31645 [Amycolatopsis sp. NPDC003865]